MLCKLVTLLVFITLSLAWRPHHDSSNCSIENAPLRQDVIYNCSGRKLHGVPVDFPDNVTVIDLSYNRITSITPGNFAHLRNLSRLYLSDNRIGKLELGAFNNKLGQSDTIANGSYSSPFRWLANLTYLDLSSNEMEKVSPTLFNNNTKLQVIDLSYNRITSITPGNFAHLRNLSRLYLSDNRIGKLELGAFVDVPNLRVLNLRSNYLRMDYESFPRGVFKNLSQLQCFLQTIKTLDISGNKYLGLNRLGGVFYGLQNSSLERLILNATTSPEDRTYLNWSWTFRSKPVVQFEQQLIHGQFKFNCFSPPNLEVADFNDNNVRYPLNHIIVHNATSLRFLNLSNNNFYEWNGPWEVLDNSFQKMSTLDLSVTCASQFTLTLVSVVVSLVIVTVVMFAVYYRFRWEIKYFFYKLRIRRKEYEEVHGDDNYQYDAFVAFSKEDYKWVYRQLRPKLEDAEAEEDRLRLCLHHRDFLPGEDIEENIIQSISQSRKTVLVISQNFVRSNWCYFEMKMARMRLFEEGKDVLVLILLEDIPFREMNDTLFHLFKSKSYLEWSEHEGAHDLFWRKLKMVLKRKNV
ncbi:toll-like receptor 4 [Lingula anatina]|uniref:Toll-like receptor 4 n=1 Tax=Lingula anatina TaxID=7574 RepID=A0A2R2MJV3_LINAN|nr:toll-like receptor 4 [Lingula anatina]|eukprot:XP_023930478.1 toll-like receptor 4 [Lingula anatina]